MNIKYFFAHRLLYFLVRALRLSEVFFLFADRLWWHVYAISYLPVFFFVNWWNWFSQNGCCKSINNLQIGFNNFADWWETPQNRILKTCLVQTQNYWITKIIFTDERPLHINRPHYKIKCILCIRVEHRVLKNIFKCWGILWLLS